MKYHIFHPEFILKLLCDWVYGSGYLSRVFIQEITKILLLFFLK